MLESKQPFCCAVHKIVALHWLARSCWDYLSRSGAWGFWHYPWVSFSDIWGLWRIDSQRLGHLQGLYSSSSRGMQGAWRGCISMYWHAFSLAAMGSKSKMGGPQSWGFIPLNYAAWGQSPANQQRYGKHWKTMETRQIVENRQIVDHFPWDTFLFPPFPPSQNHSESIVLPRSWGCFFLWTSVGQALANLSNPGSNTSFMFFLCKSSVNMFWISYWYILVIFKQ